MRLRAENETAAGADGRYVEGMATPDALREYLGEMFGQIGERFDRVDERLDRVERKVNHTGFSGDCGVGCDGLTVVGVLVFDRGGMAGGAGEPSRDSAPTSRRSSHTVQSRGCPSPGPC